MEVAVVLDRLRYPDGAARFDPRVTLATALGAAVGRDVDVVVLNDARLPCSDGASSYRRYAKIKVDAIRG